MAVNKFTAPKTSHLRSAAYNPAHDNLEVTFKDGAVYEYEGVSGQRWSQFRKASSKGNYLNCKITPNYEGQKIT